MVTTTDAGEQRRGMIALAISSLVVGAAAGLLGVMFRLALERADTWRGRFISYAHDESVVGFIALALAVSTLTAFSAWLVKRFSPEASGSGIPHVEAVLRGDQRPATLVLLPVKFVGGVIAIGAGLALGREGPIVQMGASLAHLIGKLFRRNARDCLVLVAAGAGAGLATAFNAPIAGAVFVLEELMRRFETRTAVAALGASAGAIVVARLMHGDAPDFAFAGHGVPGFPLLPAHLVLGAALGLLGVAYCHAILFALAVSDRLAHWPVEARAALIGALVGVLGWFAPDLVGGGDGLTQRAIDGSGILSGIVYVLLVRAVLGAVSYAAGTPGGLFAPMLVLGAQTGLAFGLLWHSVVDKTADPADFAVVGMAAFFAAVVRAPVTGIVLVMEMTASFALLLPMLTACFSAMIVPIALGCLPIYDALGERLPRNRVDPQTR
ncbi:H(+)/Cl(-) exchange transporter ClcA [Paraburkholderia sp. SARCC-3016]|uniref:H(+)/Cl(-) exchange transporter ClcA n=1 Tax=Paraburkholderia sp. SARCC-3016 TaxID=3058611 RepID=UPI002808AD1D|nr:H(+)/Cl(-) exchange transporter ClcA [Paraburkholderia sp. SARCC-3016]MDQ7979541.1 H(+)/Cl(-) exchange transporter ClcA [Paraburkholderia sp. SARCC-3016]